MRQYWVYIMTNTSRTLYTGVTNDLERRLYEHKHRLVPGFTSKCHITMLAYYEEFSDIREAIAREKQIKAGSRRNKVGMITRFNRTWRDLYDEM